MSYEPIIGIEVHVELATDSKMFCGCSANHFNVEPNTHTCPVCLGLPGALPVPNRRAIEWCLMIGLALNSKIAEQSKFDRKHYFYPDLPKGYQISQYDKPFCSGGEVIVKDGKEPKKIRVNRVHMEEDTGKLIHKQENQKKFTLVDFNRSGVPLVEIVSEPDIRSSEQAVFYLKKLQQIIRYLGVSDCDMEKGSMRCEVNISLRKKGEKKFSDYKVEVKNLNSFKFVKDAVEYEVERQKKILHSGEMPVQETRGFDSAEGKTFSQRFKEMAHDYRYFPEPDIPPLRWSREEIETLEKRIPELPEEKRDRFEKEYGIRDHNARVLTDTREIALYFENAVKAAKGENLSPPKIAKIIVNKRMNIDELRPEEMIRLLVEKQESRITDDDKLRSVIKEVIEENPEAASDFKGGKKEAVGFLMGQVMKATQGRAKGDKTEKLLIEELKNI